MKWFAEPFKFIGRKIYALFKFIIKNWLKILLYTFDIIAIGAIVTTIYFTITLQFYWWYILILSGSGLYVIIHHARSIWKVLKFIAVDVVYGTIKAIYNLNIRMFKAIGRFFKKYWKILLKEFVRLILVGAGIVLIYFGDQLEPEIIGTVMLWVGVALIPISALFSRIVVLKYIWNAIKRFFINLKNAIVGAYHLCIRFFKAIGRFIRRYSVWILRIIGLVAVIYGFIVSFSIGWGDLLTILTVSIGGFLLVFADFIIHPRKFWNLIKLIPKRIWQVLKTIGLSIKYATTYVVSNFLRLLLLVTTLFTLVYGISLIATFDFLNLILAVLPPEYIYKLAVGGGLVIVAVGAFVLLRRELKKLRTGQSKNWLTDVKEVWEK